MRVRDIILPQDTVFLEFFVLLADRITLASDLLADQITHLSDDGLHCNKIRTLEHESDDIVRKIFERLEESLITPIEPDEIERLAKALDDVMDIIDWVSHQICNYKVKEPDRYLRQFVELISLAIREIHISINLIGTPEKYHEIRHSIGEINQIWNQTADLLGSAVSELFTSQDMMHIIKLKDIYENLEEVLQECNDVGHVLNDIVKRHS